MHYSKSKDFTLSERSLNILRNVVHYTLEKRKYKKTSKITTIRELSKVVKVSPFGIESWIAGEHTLSLAKILEIINVLGLDMDMVLFMFINTNNLAGGIDKKEWLKGQQQEMFANLRDVSKITNVFELRD